MPSPIPYIRAKTPIKPLTPEQQERHRRIGELVRRAEALLEKNDVKGAEQAANAAIALVERPEHRWPLDVLARVYLRQGRYEEAARMYGFRATMNLTAALALVRSGRVAEARRSYKEAHIL